MNVLIGDIGGTKTILAVFSVEAGPRKPLAEISYPSAGYESLEAIIAKFLGEINLPVGLGCFGVAGPVVEGTAQITNLPWIINAEKIKSIFNWETVVLLNDLEAVAYAISILEAEDVFTLSAGEPVRGGNISVVAPGTGLGEAFLTFQGGRYRAHASEGSHASFAPAGKLQLGLLEFIHAQGHEHVSFERVCSGGLGIPNLYSYLKSIRYAEEPAWLTEKLAVCVDPAPIIFNAAQDASRPCELAVATLDLFVTILGAEAGNLALKVLSTGGIYLGGGISPRIINELKRPGFLESIRSKGRFRDLLTRMPVHVILNSKAGLFGAAVHGLSL